MNTRLLIIAHAPLAHALRECALHVFPDCWQEVLALDVPRDVVMQDYLLTNDLYRMPALPDARAPREVLHVLWRVQQEFLDAALHAVDADYGGVQPYLARALGVGEAERAQLKRWYLQHD